MKISNPEMKVIRFANEDVIATSLYYMSAADYNEAMGTNYTTPYIALRSLPLSPLRKKICSLFAADTLKKPALLSPALRHLTRSTLTTVIFTLKALPIRKALVSNSTATYQ